MDFRLLESLIEIASPTGEEYKMKDFLLDYVKKEQKNWLHTPQILEGEGLQDCLILVFGQPSTAVYVHIDTVGFTARYENQLLSIGSPEYTKNDSLVGCDNLGDILCQAETDKHGRLFYKFGRGIERGTSLTYQPKFSEQETLISSPYLDNRLGIFVALELAKELSNGALVFSCGEEHGGGYAGFLARNLYESYNIKQALIADVTWDTDGVHRGNGVVISMRDAFIPRRKFVDAIIRIAETSGVAYQLEVEGAGGSDGSEIQKLPYPIDWCFIGAPVTNPHTAREAIYKSDVTQMIALYKVLLAEL